MFKRCLVGCALFSLLLAGCSVGLQADKETGAEEVLVTASFYPLYDFALNVVGDADLVSSVIPTGVEPHDYEPSPRDLLRIYNSKLFIYNGAEMDPWAEKIAPELESKGVKVIELASLVDLLPSDHKHEEDDHSHDDHEHEKDEHHEDEKHDDHGDDHDHAHGEYDPHYWLDPVIAMELTKAIAESLAEVDSENAAKYMENAEKFVAELGKVDEAYKKGLKACGLDVTIASHAAFNYLASRYGFEVVSISGISSQEEPSPAKLAEITEFVKANNIGHIFFETLVSPKIAETIAAEAGVETLVFNPLEGLTSQEVEAGENYVSIMFKNLESLQKALNCK